MKANLPGWFKGCFPFRNTRTNLGIIFLSKDRIVWTKGRLCPSLDSRDNVVPRCGWEWSCAGHRGWAQGMRKPHQSCPSGLQTFHLSSFQNLYLVAPSRENLKSVFWEMQVLYKLRVYFFIFVLHGSEWEQGAENPWDHHKPKELFSKATHLKGMSQFWDTWAISCFARFVSSPSYGWNCLQMKIMGIWK